MGGLTTEKENNVGLSSDRDVFRSLLSLACGAVNHTGGEIIKAEGWRRSLSALRSAAALRETEGEGERRKMRREADKTNPLFFFLLCASSA